MMSFEELEAVRAKYRNKIITAVLSWLLVTSIISILSYVYSQVAVLQVLRVVISILMIIIGIIITVGPAKEYKKTYKDYFVKKSLEKIFTDLKYLPDDGLNRSVIANTGMMDMGDVYSSNDYIEGKYKDINFVQADVHIEEEHTTTDSDGNTHTYYVTIFRGRWMIFDFNKQFKANVQVCEKGFGNNRFYSKVKYEHIKMESLMFNKKFNVYAQNAHDAFYILTPSLMEKIQRLDERNTGKLLLCFINNQLHVGLYDGKDSFEPSFCFKKINEEAELKKMSTDIEQITMFVDELQLDNDLFRKGV